MKRKSVLILILLLSMFLVGCNRSNQKNPDGTSVDVFYIDSKTSGLVSENYDLIGTKTEDQIDELLYMLKKTPKNMLYKSAMPEDTAISKFYFDESSNLIIDFDANYKNLKGIPEVLCRAAIVKTLSQLTKVEAVQFYVNEQPLTDSNEKLILPMTDEDFINNPEESTIYKVKLYFANKAGDGLIEYITDIKSSANESIEELALQQLINGPTVAGMYSTIPDGTVLLNVTKSNGICNVDFNEKFLEKLQNVDENVAIYSVVNTLVELPDINKVKFTINGEVQKTYWEDMPFDVTFKNNLNIIDSSN